MPDSSAQDFTPIYERMEPASMKSSIYNSHIYWAKKPYNVTQNYIRYFTNPDEIVMDPFVGCGVVAVEALKVRRKVVAIDINPLSTFMTRMLATSPIDLKKLDKSFAQVESDVRDKILSYYETLCPGCGGNAFITTLYYDYDLPKNPLKYFCSTCKKRGVNTNNFDLKKIKEVNILADEKLISFPRIELVENPRKQIKKGTYVQDLFKAEPSFIDRPIQRNRQAAERDLQRITKICF